MARLPVPGADNGAWGQILNDFLSIEHNADGSLKLRSDPALTDKYSKPNTGIPKSDLTSAVQASLDKADNAVANDALVWNAKSHGVVGDGVTDDTQNIKTFLSNTIAAGAVAFFPAGTYLSSWFYIAAAPKIFAIPGTVTIKMTQTNDGWNFGPTSYGTSTTLTADAAIGATQLQLASIPTGVSVGAIILVGDTALKVGGNSATNTVSANNLYRVTAVSGNTVTIAGGTTTLSSGSPTPQGLVQPITAATGSVTALPNMVSDAFVRGLNFVCSSGASNTATALTFRQVRNLDLDVSCTGFGNANLIVADCWLPRVRASINQALNIDVSGVSGQFGYGVDLSGATAHADVMVVCDQARHAVSLSGTGHNARIQGVATNTTNSAWDAHAGFTNVLFDGCIADGCSNGFALRGDRYRINGGTIDNCYNGVMVFDRPISVSIKGLHIKNCNTGILVNSVGSSSTPGSGLTVDGCSIDDSNGAGISFPATTSAFTDVRIVNNSFRNSGKASSAPHILIAAALTRLRIHRNLFEDNQTVATTSAAVNITVAASDATFVNNDLQNSLTAISGSQAATITQPASIFTPQITSYTAAGTYTFTLPSGATRLSVTCIGGGGGGGAGRQGAAGSVCAGGGGGGGGGITSITLPTSILTSSVTVTVGTGGNGASAQASTDTNGATGTGGGTTSFGTYLRAAGGAAGAGGGTANAAGGAGGSALSSGGPGNSSNVTGPNGNGANFTVGCGGAGGAGGGGSITAANAAGTGGGGAQSPTCNIPTAGSSGAVGTAGGSATNAPTGLPGAGGGGGGANTTGTGGAGGGGITGGGGGGGGAATNGNASGAGGRGGDGIVYIIAS